MASPRKQSLASRAGAAARRVVKGRPEDGLETEVAEAVDTVKSTATKAVKTAKKAAKKTAQKTAEKAAPVKETAEKAAAQSAAKTAKVAEKAAEQAPVKKAAAKKVAKAATKKVAATKAPAKKAPAKKAPAKKAPAKKAPAKKAPAKKAPAKKTPATKAAAQAQPAQPASTVAALTHGVDDPVIANPPVDEPPRTKAVGGKTVKGARKGSPGSLVVLDSEEGWTKAELDEVREHLRADITRLTDELQIAEEDLAGLLRDAGEGAGNDQADVGSASFERDQEVQIANNARDMLEGSVHALDRIAAGTYGICESRGEPIGKNRLMVFPRATLCLSCKQREERR